MTYYIIAGLNLSAFAMTCLVALLRYRILDKGMRFFAISCITAFFTELLALIWAFYYENNMPVYAIYNVVEVLLVCLFFNYSIPSLRRKNIGLWLGVISALLGIVNLMFFQPLKSLNSNFIYYQGILVIALSMFAIIDEIMRSEENGNRFSPKFYISVLLIIYWVVSFLYWGLYEYLIGIFGKDNILIGYLMALVCCLLNVAFSYLLIRYPKSKRDV
ncbi:hypothetical protein [Pedobacter sp.]